MQQRVLYVYTVERDEMRVVEVDGNAANTGDSTTSSGFNRCVIISDPKIGISGVIIQNCH